jgi:hypothetical protein
LVSPGGVPGHSLITTGSALMETLQTMSSHPNVAILKQIVAPKCDREIFI